MDENINFFFNDDNKDTDLTNILNEINAYNHEEVKNIDNLFHEVVNYSINYTVKQLIQICEYYNISKDVRMTKCNKEEIINTIVLFESEQCNHTITCIRKKMWFYINELKGDKFMKKFVLWN